MKPSLQFRLSQHLTLTPQLQQSIRLLQLSTVELNQEIERMLMENPLLEREDARRAASSDAPRAAAEPVESGARARRASEAPAAPETDWPTEAAANWRGAATTTRTATAASPRRTRRRCATTCAAQLSLTNLAERDRILVELLIDALDEDGYLTQPLEEIAALLRRRKPEADRKRRAMEELQIALRHLQNFEPAGVGARSPGECLRPAAARLCARRAPAQRARAARSSRSTSSCSPRATTRA